MCLSFGGGHAWVGVAWHAAGPRWVPNQKKCTDETCSLCHATLVGYRAVVFHAASLCHAALVGYRATHSCVTVRIRGRMPATWSPLRPRARRWRWRCRCLNPPYALSPHGTGSRGKRPASTGCGAWKGKSKNDLSTHFLGLPWRRTFMAARCVCISGAGSETVLVHGEYMWHNWNVSF